MAELEELIFDRTQADVINKSQKAFYNLKDLQRLQSYIDYVAAQKNLTLPTHMWVLGECCEYWKFQYYILNNVNKIRRYYLLPDSTPNTPTIEKWDYKKANDLEKILYDCLHNAIIIKGFALDSWSTINRVLESGNAQNFYNIGDNRSEALNDGQIVTFTIYSFGDKNLADGSGTARMTIVGDVTPKKYAFNSSYSTEFDYGDSDIHKIVLPEIFNLLNIELQNLIKTVVVTYRDARADRMRSVESKLFITGEYERTPDLFNEAIVDRFVNYDIWGRSMGYKMPNYGIYYKEQNPADEKYSIDYSAQNEHYIVWCFCI